MELNSFPSSLKCHFLDNPTPRIIRGRIKYVVNFNHSGKLKTRELTLKGIDKDGKLILVSDSYGPYYVSIDDIRNISRCWK